MGMYKNLTKATPTTAVLTDQGIAIQTMQKLMNNYTVDATQPTFPSGIDGVVFDSASNKIYVVWAITTLDMSETASGTYTLPSGVSFKEYKYNMVSPGTVSGTVSLTGEPVFLVQTSGSISSVNCNAGSSQTITLPTSTASLSASASTVTGSTISSYAWTQVSGPSTATIADASTVSATASALVAGTYVFKVAIKDAAGDTCSSTVQITVDAASSGSSITISAGSAQTITLPTSTATLTGTVTDKTATIKSYAWTESSGPNTATISSPSSESTTVKGLEAGTYVFELKVTDNNDLTATATVTITVKSSTTKTRYAVNASTGGQQTQSAQISADQSEASPESIRDTLILFPNPAQSTINLRLTTDTVGTMSIGIYDMLGKLLLSQQTNKTQAYYNTTINVAKLAGGFYFMQVAIGNEKRMIVKFIKQ
jgi:hypothetical protein